MIEILLAALLTIYPNIPAARRTCIMNNRERIMKYVGMGVDKHDIPPSLILTVGFLESHFGCNPRSGGSWGSPIDRNHRNIAGTPVHTARDLAISRRVCGSWFGALARYQSGLCHGSLPEIKDEYILDVGVDCYDFQPLHFDTIKALMDKKEYRQKFDNDRD